MRISDRDVEKMLDEFYGKPLTLLVEILSEHVSDGFLIAVTNVLLNDAGAEELNLVALEDRLKNREEFQKLPRKQQMAAANAIYSAYYLFHLVIPVYFAYRMRLPKVTCSDLGKFIDGLKPSQETLRPDLALRRNIKIWNTHWSDVLTNYENSIEPLSDKAKMDMAIFALAIISKLPSPIRPDEDQNQEKPRPRQGGGSSVMDEVNRILGYDKN